MNQIIREQKEKQEENIPKIEDIKRQQKPKRTKGKNIAKKIFITLGILIVIGISTLGILLYGPYSGFRDWLITSAMTTMTHQWIAYLFYDQETIDAVMANKQSGTDTSTIENEIDNIIYSLYDLNLEEIAFIKNQ